MYSSHLRASNAWCLLCNLGGVGLTDIEYADASYKLATVWAQVTAPKRGSDLRQMLLVMCLTSRSPKLLGRAPGFRVILRESEDSHSGGIPIKSGLTQVSAPRRS
jgi:hypothetical protein